MPKTAVANEAGSAGKSTSTVNVGAELAKRGRAVRVIDMDPQGNASHNLGVTNPEVTMADVLLGRASIEEAEVQTKIEGLTLVPATPDLHPAAIELTTMLGGEQQLRRAMAVAPRRDNDIFDCPGALGVLTVGALVAADQVITVTLASLKEMGGIPRILETIAEVRDAYNPVLQLGGIIPCAVQPPNRGKVYAMALDLLREEFGDLVTPSVRFSARVPESYSHQVPLIVHAPEEDVTFDYAKVVDYLIARGVV